MGNSGSSAGSWIPIIGDVMNAVSAIGGSIQNMQMQDRAFEYNKQMTDLAWERNLEMWDLQNQYNSPQAQLERIKQAGINPNIAFGSGVSATSGNNQSRPSYQPPQYVAPTMQRFQASGIYNVAQEIRAERLLNGQLDVMKTEGKKNTATAIKTLLESENIEKLMPYQLEKMISEIGAIQQKTEREDFELRKAELLLPGEQLLQQLNITEKQLQNMYKEHTLDARIAAAYIANSLAQSQISLNRQQAQKLFHDTINSVIRHGTEESNSAKAFYEAMLSEEKYIQYRVYGMTKKEYQEYRINLKRALQKDEELLRQWYDSYTGSTTDLIDAIVPF